MKTILRRQKPTSGLAHYYLVNWTWNPASYGITNESPWEGRAENRKGWTRDRLSEMYMAISEDFGWSDYKPSLVVDILIFAESDMTMINSCKQTKWGDEQCIYMKNSGTTLNFYTSREK